ncbi:MAG TPA: PocR ligand-binding domain-containing protein [Negativicutes bacterium]|nr:PocR ligand-binding domain-containing protein [Negativicutes bacterium]
MMNLRDLIDVDILQDIQDRFAEATGLAAVTVDFRGKPVTRYSRFTKFCMLSRRDPKCLEACYRSDAHGGLEAARRGRPYIYRCHMGLVDFAIPIIIKDQYLGSIMSGQVKIEESEMNHLDLIVKEVPGWRDKKEVMEAYEEIHVTSYDMVKAAAELMFLVSNYIVEKDMMQLMQEELNQKNLKLMEEIRVRAELERTLKDTEIKTLQSQVNPHFLFNVLNTLSRLALTEKAPKTQEMAYSLAETLRYILQNINQMVSLDEELAQIERYLKIQSVRFGERIQYKLEVQEEIKKVRIPSMLLQTFVENAVNHGLEPKEEPGIVKVSGYSTDEAAVIEITDDGVGIPESKLKLLLEEADISSISQSTGIGINNANKRLIYYYGPEYKLKIRSVQNKGTTVTIRIPKKIKSRGSSNVQSAFSR